MSNNISNLRAASACVRVPHVSLVLILLLAALLRGLALGDIPNGFYHDEAFVGYDAYSMVETWRDQYGEFLPFFARADGFYNESLYRYATALSVAVCGLSEFSTRVPAAIVGVLNVWCLFALVRTWFDRDLALMAAFFLAISPWHIQFSRVAVSAIFLPLCFCLALWLFGKALKRPNYLLPCAAAFAATLYTYSSARVFVPLFMLGLLCLFWREVYQQKGKTLIAGLFFAVVFFLLFTFWITPEGMARARTVLSTDYLSIPLYYLSYFNPLFLFYDGDPNLRHSIWYMGQLYHCELLFVPLGLWGLYKDRGKTSAVMWLWLALYPIPAAFTEAEHSLRAIVGAPLFAILSAYGLKVTSGACSSFRAKRSLMLVVVAVLAVNFGVYCNFYFVDYPVYGARAWQYGMKQAISYIRENGYGKVIMGHVPVPHIFVLFYTHFPPEEYHEFPLEWRQKLWRARGVPVGFGGFYFSVVESLELPPGKALLIAEPADVEVVAAKGYAHRKLHSFKDPAGVEVLSLLEIRH